MKMGTKSLLFGVHQFLLHPFFVAWAWRRLYRRWPDRWEWVAIIIHDWGYWGSPDMDGETGRLHPLRSASWWVALTNRWPFYLISDEACERVLNLVRHHSRFAALKEGREPSELCWPDKLAFALYPRDLYLFLANLSGEIHEYMDHCRKDGFICHVDTDVDWFNKVRAYMLEVSDKKIMPNETNSGI